VPDEDHSDEPTAPLPETPPPAEPTAPAETPRSRRGTVTLIALVGVLALVLCGGGTAALYLVDTADRQPAAAASKPPTPRSHPESAAPPSPSFDPGSIIRGNCVVNQGTDDAPMIRLASCGPGAYDVLVRIDSTSDTTKCRTVPGATHHYFYSTTPATLDFVLCLRKH